MIAIETLTIAALSTPPGAGGIAIIRLSGVQAHAIVSRIFRVWPSKVDFFHLYLGFVYDPASQRDLDQVLLTLMPAGRSYTGEDMAEIHCHGGIYISKKILSLLFKLGAQPAPPGEFTKRAYLNGRFDLTQAEAVSALISAESEAGLAAATAQLAGGLAQNIRAMLEQVNRILAALEVEIDLLAEEGLNYAQPGWTASLSRINHACRGLLDSYRRGRILCNGIKVVLAGRPNVGKSSIMNALLAEERALVSAVSGTTRDVVSAALEIGGIKVELSDTAGLLDKVLPDNPQAELEALGMARTEAWLEQASLILLVLDQSRDLTDFEVELYQRIRQKPHLLLLNKQDKKPAFTIAELRRRLVYEGPVSGCIGVRGKINIDAVVAGIEEFIKSTTAADTETAVMVIHQRHYDLLCAAAAGLTQTLDLVACGAPPLDMLADELHQVRLRLLEIIGEDTSVADSLLDVVFSQFCVGK
jgi:tRNA modification GTPase